MFCEKWMTLSKESVIYLKTGIIWTLTKPSHFRRFSWRQWRMWKCTIAIYVCPVAKGKHLPPSPSLCICVHASVCVLTTLHHTGLTHTQLPDLSRYLNVLQFIRGRGFHFQVSFQVWLRLQIHNFYILIHITRCLLWENPLTLIFTYCRK